MKCIETEFIERIGKDQISVSDNNAKRQHLNKLLIDHREEKKVNSVILTNWNSYIIRG